jgi:hypothetical protein
MISTPALIDLGAGLDLSLDLLALPLLERRGFLGSCHVNLTR